jgi:quercetin dioxygenase-like cupin family protein
MRPIEEPCGGDPPCWAHLSEDDDDLADEAGAARVEIADLVPIALSQRAYGPAWTLESDDLNVNLLVFDAGDGVDEHVNDEVDVLLVGIMGEGVVTIDGRSHSLHDGQAVLIPKGARRAIHALDGRFAYLTCHRRRPGLWPTPGKRSTP